MAAIRRHANLQPGEAKSTSGRHMAWDVIRALSGNENSSERNSLAANLVEILVYHEDDFSGHLVRFPGIFRVRRGHEWCGHEGPSVPNRAVCNGSLRVRYDEKDGLGSCR